MAENETREALHAAGIDAGAESLGYPALPETYIKVVRAAIDAVVHIRCDCVPSIGPAHCHACSRREGREVPWAEAHPEPEQTEAVVMRAARLIQPDAWSEMTEMEWFEEYGEDSVIRANADREWRKRSSLDTARRVLSMLKTEEEA